MPKSENQSFFTPLNPFRRPNSSSPHACAGIKSSCELYCPSYVSQAEIEESNLGNWTFDAKELERLSAPSNKGKNWLLPADMDMYANDFPSALRKTLFEELENHTNCQFYIVTKNPFQMLDEWFFSENITWMHSVSSQEELNFLNVVLESKGSYKYTKEALLISPLTEFIDLPEALTQRFQYIFVNGLRGKSELNLSLELESIFHLEEQLKASQTELVIDDLGDCPLVYQGRVAKINLRRPISTTDIAKKLKISQ